MNWKEDRHPRHDPQAPTPEATPLAVDTDAKVDLDALEAAKYAQRQERCRATRKFLAIGRTKLRL